MEYLQRMLNKSKALVSNHFWGITWSILRQMNQITLVLYSRNDFFMISLIIAWENTTVTNVVRSFHFIKN